MDKISELKTIILNTLDLNKALDIISIDLENKSSMADYMIIASGTSSRHIQALSEQVLEKFKNNGIKNCKIEGKESNDWKLIDGNDVIVHIFNPEKRKFYELEKMWSELNSKRKSSNMIKIKKSLILIIIYLLFLNNVFAANDGIYKKIDLFSEVLEKINKEYVDEIDQNKTMDCSYKWSFTITRPLLFIYDTISI